MENCVIVLRPSSRYWNGPKLIQFWTGTKFSPEYPDALLMSDREAGKEAKKLAEQKLSVEVIKDYGLNTEEMVYKT